MTEEEKLAEEYVNNKADKGNYDLEQFGKAYFSESSMKQAFLAGLKAGKRQVKNELMLKLKDEGIVKPLKDSVCCNRKLSSQEQQELCAWIECAIDFGSNLDECADQLTKAKEIIKDLMKMPILLVAEETKTEAEIEELFKQAEDFIKE